MYQIGSLIRFVNIPIVGLTVPHKEICSSPNPVNVTLFGDSFCRCNQLRGSTGLGWPLNPVSGALIRRP